MALSLSKKIGETIRIGDDFVTVKEISSDESFILYCEGMGEDGQLVEITSLEAKEVFPEVYISAGIGHSSLARLAITAPKSVDIDRCSECG